MKLFSIHRTMSLLAQLYAFWSRIFPVLSGEANPVTAMSAVRHASQYLSTRRTPWVLEPCQTTFWGLKSNFVHVTFSLTWLGKRVSLSLVNGLQLLSPLWSMQITSLISSWCFPPNSEHILVRLYSVFVDWIWTTAHEVSLSRVVLLSVLDQWCFLIFQSPVMSPLAGGLLRFSLLSENECFPYVLIISVSPVYNHNNPSTSIV